MLPVIARLQITPMSFKMINTHADFCAAPNKEIKGEKAIMISKNW